MSRPVIRTVNVYAEEPGERSAFIYDRDTRSGVAVSAREVNGALRIDVNRSYGDVVIVLPGAESGEAEDRQVEVGVEPRVVTVRMRDWPRVPEGKG